jgi:type 1 glutamine amidotransferase
LIGMYIMVMVLKRRFGRILVFYSSLFTGSKDIRVDKSFLI